LASNWPLPNLVLGVSVENQRTADERIPMLLQIPAAKRFISMEPLLAEIDLYRGGFSFLHNLKSPQGKKYPALDGVILGGESGNKARVLDPDWIRSVRDQCNNAGVPFMLKQYSSAGSPGRPYEYIGDDGFPLLDGRTHKDLSW
jgi:protein gp37